MFSRYILLLLFCCLSSSIASITVYSNAQFVPINASFQLANLSSVRSWEQCACLCLADSRCLTTNYFGINQSCSLFSAPIIPESLQIVIATMNAITVSVTDKTIPGEWNLTISLCGFIAQDQENIRPEAHRIAQIK